jgi:hypothetical protein
MSHEGTFWTDNTEKKCMFLGGVMLLFFVCFFKSKHYLSTFVEHSFYSSKIEENGIPNKRVKTAENENVTCSVWSSVFMDGSGNCKLPSMPHKSRISFNNIPLLL